MHVLERFGFALLLACSVAACGDDSTAGGTGDAGDDGGGAPPPPPPPKDSGTPMTMTGMFECGANMCTTPEFMIPPGLLGGADGGMGAIPPELAGLLGGGASICELAMTCSEGCCTDSGACGVKNTALTGPSCVEQGQEGAPNADCPDVEVVLNNALVTMFAGGPLNVPIPGCCRTSDSKCGLDLSYLGMGCVERSAAEYGSMISPPDGGTGMLESISCTPGATGGDDGGTDDAG
jgi:hypothetical protein